MAHDIPRRLTLKNVSYGISWTMGRFYYNIIPKQNRICTELRVGERASGRQEFFNLLASLPAVAGDREDC